MGPTFNTVVGTTATWWLHSLPVEKALQWRDQSHLDSHCWSQACHCPAWGLTAGRGGCLASSTVPLLQGGRRPVDSAAGES